MMKDYINFSVSFPCIPRNRLLAACRDCPKRSLFMVSPLGMGLRPAPMTISGGFMLREESIYSTPTDRTLRRHTRHSWHTGWWCDMVSGTAAPVSCGGLGWRVSSVSGLTTSRETQDSLVGNPHSCCHRGLLISTACFCRSIRK